MNLALVLAIFCSFAGAVPATSNELEKQALAKQRVNEAFGEASDSDEAASLFFGNWKESFRKYVAKKNKECQEKCDAHYKQFEHTDWYKTGMPVNNCYKSCNDQWTCCSAKYISKSGRTFSLGNICDKRSC